MFLSVIICTYRRAQDLAVLLRCLSVQTCRNFEVLVVDGSGDDPTVRQEVEKFCRHGGRNLDMRLIQAPAGLTRQRNVGLRECRGDVVCFFDDDVAFSEDFLAQVADLLEQPGMEDVGGVTAYDVLHSPRPITFRWRLRRWLGTIPSLKPGDVDHLGRGVLLNFFEPFTGCKPVGWLPGLCMIYRREAIEGLCFDEELPVYAGEDRDFSMRVGARCRLALCGDLRLEHRRSPQNRVPGAHEMYRRGFGAGRRFAKHGRGLRDQWTIARYLVGEFIVNLLAIAKRPSRLRLSLPFSYTLGILAGLRSFRRQASSMRSIPPRP